MCCTVLRLKFFAGQLQRPAPLFDKPLEGRVTRVPDPAPLALDHALALPAKAIRVNPCPSVVEIQNRTIGVGGAKIDR